MTTSCPRAMKGQSSDVNSMSAATTRPRPGSTAAATSATSSETVAPVATRSGGTPTSPAQSSRARPVDSPQGSQLVRPPCQSSSAARSASQAGRGGSP